MSIPLLAVRLDADHRPVVEALLEWLPIGIILVEDAGGERIVANRRAEALFGHPLRPEEGIVQNLGHVCWPNGTPCTLNELPTMRALRGEVVSGEELLLRRLDGREVPVLVQTSPIRDASGGVAGALAVLDDLSSIKELERLREEWTSIVAHDLRQPVTVVLGYATQLARRGHSDDTPRAKAIEHILASANQLRRMINDLLDASRLEARRLALERQSLDLVGLVSTVVERTAKVTVGRAVRFEPASGAIPRVWADPSRIEQVLGNLLSNAARYGYPGAEIRVRVNRVVGEVEVSVANAGDGIAPDELPKLFARFRRRRRFAEDGIPGLGLGLYITRGLVEAHGGRIWVESTPGQTTTFYFTIPEEARAP
ncbi:MAG TPA: ATP-binding protein [Chloroflexota bacterium]|nr:ATP-binding protein [Chloroflexota bacterium]